MSNCDCQKNIKKPINDGSTVDATAAKNLLEIGLIAVLTWLCYVWHVDLGYIFPFGFEGKLYPMLYLGI